MAGILHEYVEQERELQRRREERRDAPTWRRAKWWVVRQERGVGPWWQLSSSLRQDGVVLRRDRYEFVIHINHTCAATGVVAVANTGAAGYDSGAIWGKHIFYPVLRRQSRCANTPDNS